MKFDTKKCSPMNLRSSKATSEAMLPSRGLDSRDLVWRNPNQYIDESSSSSASGSDDEDENYSTDLGRRVEHIPRLVYTPVKVSARNKYSANESASSSHKTTRTVTDREMEDLNSCLMNLCFGEDDAENAAPGFASTNNRTAAHHAASPLLGRIPEQHVDAKTGRTVTVWRSSRKSKKVDHFSY